MRKTGGLVQKPSRMNTCKLCILFARTSQVGPAQKEMSLFVDRRNVSRSTAQNQSLADAGREGFLDSL